MINSVCGKTIENLWKRIRLANNDDYSRPTHINTPADQRILLIKYLVKIMLLFMK